MFSEPRGLQHQSQPEPMVGQSDHAPKHSPHTLIKHSGTAWNLFQYLSVVGWDVRLNAAVNPDSDVPASNAFLENDVSEVRCPSVREMRARGLHPALRDVNIYSICDREEESCPASLSDRRHVLRALQFSYNSKGELFVKFVCAMFPREQADANAAVHTALVRANAANNNNHYNSVGDNNPYAINALFDADIDGDGIGDDETQTTLGPFRVATGEPLLIRYSRVVGLYAACRKITCLDVEAGGEDVASLCVSDPSLMQWFRELTANAPAVTEDMYRVFENLLCGYEVPVTEGDAGALAALCACRSAVENRPLFSYLIEEGQFNFLAISSFPRLIIQQQLDELSRDAVTDAFIFRKYRGADPTDKKQSLPYRVDQAVAAAKQLLTHSNEHDSPHLLTLAMARADHLARELELLKSSLAIFQDAHPWRTVLDQVRLVQPLDPDLRNWIVRHGGKTTREWIDAASRKRLCSTAEIDLLLVWTALPEALRRASSSVAEDIWSQYEAVKGGALPAERVMEHADNMQEVRNLRSQNQNRREDANFLDTTRSLAREILRHDEDQHQQLYTATNNRQNVSHHRSSDSIAENRHHNTRVDFSNNTVASNHSQHKEKEATLPESNFARVAHDFYNRNIQAVA